MCIDGFDDLLIGAPSKLTIDWGGDSYVSTSEETTGKAYLIYGKGGDWDKNNSLSSADRIYSSGRGGDTFANKVSELGDINTDGINDFAITAIIPDLISSQDDLGFVQIIIDHYLIFQIIGLMMHDINQLVSTILIKVSVA
ncbi:MAG: hypothetical protein ACC656_08290 [Candidatus Heimdallarchaeota archaeon]